MGIGKASSFAALAIFATLGRAEAKSVNVKLFDCPIEEKYIDDGERVRSKTVHAKFALSGLEKGPKHAEFEYINKEAAENFTPVVVEPLEIYKQSWSKVAVLNDNTSLGAKYATKQITDKHTGHKRWATEKKKGPIGFEISGDGDGVETVDLVLYLNSGYTRGYFKFRGPDRKEDWYQEIICSVEDEELEVFE